MQDPSAEMLDRHFRQQVTRFQDVFYNKACPSDRLIMACWMKVFEAVPLNQKLARNGLMLLIHAHIKEFGNLRAPFTDVRNCKKDLNELLDSYRGIPETGCKDKSSSVLSQGTTPSTPLPKEQPRMMAGLSTAHSRQVSVKRANSSSQAHRMQFQSRALDPIMEETEPSEMAPSTSKHGASLIGKKSFVNKSPGECSGNQRPSSAKAQNRQSLRQKILIFEKEPVVKKSTVTLAIDPNEAATRRAPSSELPLLEQDPKTPHIPIHLTRRPSAVRNLKNCFQEMAERVVDPSENNQKPFFKTKAPTPARSKKVDFDTRNSVMMTRPSSFSKGNSKYKRRDSPAPFARSYGGLSESSDEPQREILRSLPKSKPTNLCKCPLLTAEDVQAFETGANKALARLKLWKGAPNSLHFFTTCLDISSRDMGSQEWQDLDHQLEHEIIRWIR
ncbi:hypothetical protein KR074_011437, partial [Drosophila pseudoananassae]